MALYDLCGQTYSATRHADPRIAARIADALSDAASVANVGAGTGSYEPPQTIVAIEPSRTMLSQRPAGTAPAVQALAEHIPLRDGCVDAAMAVLTIHHWSDLAAGIAEMRRIATQRLVFLTWDAAKISEFWLLAEYLPEATATDADLAIPMARLTGMLDRPRVLTVPIPFDCTDGFGAAYWRRPAAYLDPTVRAGISLLARTTAEVLAPGLDRLARDLASGTWQRDHAELLGQDSIDLGYRLVIAEA